MNISNASADKMPSLRDRGISLEESHQMVARTYPEITQQQWEAACRIVVLLLSALE
jgi:hypothetical protein